ncbi:MAG: septum formation initiator family protein [Bacteroidota bacterium]
MSKNLFIKRLLPVIKNKYFIASFAFLIILAFFDSDNLFEQMKNRQKIKELERQKEFYIKEIERNQRQLHELQTDKTNLEKFAREEYMMKKENEDVFIIVDN